MRLYIDLDSRNFLESPRFPRALTSLDLKRRDTDLIELQFIRDNTVQELSTDAAIRIGLKPAADYTGEFLATGTFTKNGTSTDTKYLLGLNLNTASINAAFSATPAEPETLAAMLEIEWSTGGTISSSKTLALTIANDVIRGDEGAPADLPLFYTAETSDFLATQAQAEAGTDNNAWMSPLRTAQAIAALAATDWDSVSDKPSEFPPAAHAHELADVTGLSTALDGKAATTHTHTQSDITGLESALLGKANATHTHPLSDLTASGATTGQVATFDGTAWGPQDANAGVTSYLDLTNVPSTFPPATHTHVVSDVTGLQTALDGKQAAGSYVTTSGGITAIAVVVSMPATPAANTLYIVTA